MNIHELTILSLKNGSKATEILYRDLVSQPQVRSTTLKTARQMSSWRQHQLIQSALVGSQGQVLASLVGYNMVSALEPRLMVFAT